MPDVFPKRTLARREKVMNAAGARADLPAEAAEQLQRAARRRAGRFDARDDFGRGDGVGQAAEQVGAGASPGPG
jgi:hypothetical protein